MRTRARVSRRAITLLVLIVNSKDDMRRIAAEMEQRASDRGIAVKRFHKD